MHLPEGVQRAKLGKALYELKDLLYTSKMSNGIKQYYIDSLGKVFPHHKTAFSNIYSFQIEKITPAPHDRNFTILRCYKVHCPIRVRNPPPIQFEKPHVSLLVYGAGYIFMGYSDHKHEEVRFKV